MLEEKYMRRAIDLARRGSGAVNPNPLVGAVIVRDGRVLGEGWHERYGQLHAERNAIAHAKEAGEDLKGSTIYVTLEEDGFTAAFSASPAYQALMESRNSALVLVPLSLDKRNSIESIELSGWSS